MVIYSISVLLLIVMIWLLKDLAKSFAFPQKVATTKDFYSWDQFKLGKNNDPMDGVVLDKGIALVKQANGKYKILPTAKYSAEFQ